ncbi:MAG TPA: PH domain-containing protein [Thermoleophilaceae bacterium]|nr:PH domain-containing protein [Thermoleophilaceae bacterium]
MANYAESLLAAGERVLRREHQHWFILVANTRYAILALIGAALLTVISVWFGIDGVLWQVLGVLTLVLFVYGIAAFLWGILRYRNEEYLITNRRLIHAEGVVNKKTTDSSLEKINDAVLTESMFGRMFGFGDLDVLTASEEGIERLRMLRDAKDFKKAMIEAKHELEIEVARPVMPPIRSEPAPVAAAPVAAPAAAAPPPTPAPVAPAAPASNDIGAALDRLGDLRDRGLITPEEYAAKRQELLDRL